MMFQVIKAARFGVAHTRSCRGRRAEAGALVAEMTLSQSLPDDVQFHKWKEIDRWKKEEDRSPRKLVAWTPRNPMNWQPSNHKLRQSLHISREALLSERKGSHAWLGISHGLSFGYMSRFFCNRKFFRAVLKFKRLWERGKCLWYFKMSRSWCVLQAWRMARGQSWENAYF